MGGIPDDARISPISTTIIKVVKLSSLLVCNFYKFTNGKQACVEDSLALAQHQIHS
ncbi:uncharacterized protein G2W53_044362 [Senna tora]|uniref:Uncharacterized protein n=1 Tax=Senna tora TaxID=362788 RepID=A0A834W4B6_9FABA|nr:uncharacterized protein G2W53_044362 [Senna tora]